MPNRKALATILAALALALLLVGPVLAQGDGPSVSGPPGPPAGLYGFTGSDNTGNGGSGPADDDMTACIYNTDSNHPIEFYIRPPAEVQPQSNGLELYLGVCDVDLDVPAGVDPEIDEVFINGELLGCLPDSTETCEVVTAPIPSGLLTEDDLVEIFVSVGEADPDEWCVNVFWGGIGPPGLDVLTDVVWPCAEEEEFVPEPGSMILLASGLMGMAGYAGLRLRKR